MYIFADMRLPNSYGAASYLITRPEGNVSGRFASIAKTLVRRIEELGGISTMFFSHRDDVADHEKFTITSVAGASFIPPMRGD